MKVTFLGTGTSQGVPVIACSCRVCASSDVRDKRLRSSVMLSLGDKNVVIDSGPDFRQQMLHHAVRNLEAIVFTHEHKDHIAGLDDVRAFNYFHKKRIPVYCTARVEEALKREYHYAFGPADYPGVPEIDPVRIHTDPFQVAGMKFKPIQVMHMHLPVLGFRVKNFVYITDANYISDEEKAKIRGVKHLVLNALRRQKHPSHYTLDEAVQLARELGAEHTWLTHISHQLGRHEEVELELPPKVHLAYDGLQIDTD